MPAQDGASETAPARDAGVLEISTSRSSQDQVGAVLSACIHGGFVHPFCDVCDVAISKSASDPLPNN